MNNCDGLTDFRLINDEFGINFMADNDCIRNRENRHNYLKLHSRLYRNDEENSTSQFHNKSVY